MHRLASRSAFTACCAMLSLVLLVSPNARANDGALDATFGNVLPGRSRVVFPSTPGLQVVASAIAQPDGRIVLAGILNYANSAQPQLGGMARLNADGSLDTTFGQNGLLVVDTSIALFDVALQADGKIVVVGESSGENTDFIVLRFNAMGQPDMSFNGTGRITVAFDLGGSNSDAAESLSILPDGKFMVAGRVARPAFASDIALVRLNADGQLDTGFAQQGREVVDAFDVPTVSVQRDNVVLHRDPDGDFYVNAVAGSGTAVYSLAMRLHSDGSIDTGYGQSGLATLSNIDAVHSALQPDGKLVLVGGNTNGSGSAFAIERLLQSGNPDSSFGGGGGDLGTTYVNFDLGGGDADIAYGVALQSDSRIVVAGVSTIAPRCSANDSAVMTAIRLLPNGQIDSAFGSGSTHSTQVDFDLGGDCLEFAYDVILQAGRPVLVGAATTDIIAGATASGVFAVARLTNDRIFSNGFD